MASLDTLNLLVNNNRGYVTKLSKAVKTSFGDMDMGIFILNQLMGKRPDSLGTSDVFSLLKSHEKLLDSSFSSITLIDHFLLGFKLTNDLIHFHTFEIEM